MLTERLPERWLWWRIADRAWQNPLDPSFAAQRGGRWNPAGSFPTLYLNEDQVSARLNLRAFIAQWPFEPEDLRSDNGPVLIGASLPRQQIVCDIHSPTGVDAVGLPPTYPLNGQGEPVAWPLCQAIGLSVKDVGWRGIKARSAQARDGVGRELAWFPATERSHAKRQTTLLFDDWYWS